MKPYETKSNNDKFEQGYLKTNDVVQREIWVQKKDGSLEVKNWFIYTFRFWGISKDKIVDFINKENTRFNWNDQIIAPQLEVIAKEYSDLDTLNRSLPPRLWIFPDHELDNLPTELSKNDKQFIFGDSVGGISFKKGFFHNEHLRSEIHSQEKILFSPGVLARVIIEIENKLYFVFQLAEKNLRKKNEIFYKPLGGHIKVKNNAYKFLKEKYEIIPKERFENQDLNDLCLYIKPTYLTDFMNLFSNDIKHKEFQYFEDPEISIAREIFEELGPTMSSDGINLLLHEDLIEIKND